MLKEWPEGKEKVDAGSPSSRSMEGRSRAKMSLSMTVTTDELIMAATSTAAWRSRPARRKRTAATSVMTARLIAPPRCVATQAAPVNHPRRQATIQLVTEGS